MVRSKKMTRIHDKNILRFLFLTIESFMKTQFQSYTLETFSIHFPNPMILWAIKPELKI